MCTIEHPLFGTMNLAAAGSWDATIPFAGHEIDVDVTLDEPNLTPAELTARLALLDKLSLRDRVARVALSEEAKAGDETASGLYFTHHREELPPEAWRQVFGTASPQTIDVDTFLAQLELVRVGLYPGDEDRCLLLDYMLRGEVTNYLLSVSFDADGQLSGIDMES